MSATEQHPAAASGSLPLRIELPLATYASLDRLASSRGVAGRRLAARFVEQAVEAACGTTLVSDLTGQSELVTDDELIRIHKLAQAHIPIEEISRQTGVGIPVVELYVKRLQPNPRVRTRRPAPKGTAPVAPIRTEAP
jgi:hypothetical protein